MNIKEYILSTLIHTPIGEMLACSTDKGICLLEFKERKDLNKQLKSITSYFKREIIPGNNKDLLKLQGQLNLYFDKRLESFNLSIEMAGTEFQRSVWNVLLEMPFGTTKSYMDLTKILGDPNAIRAVANANAANKIAIIIPCHRIIGSDGSLTGYAGSIWRKKHLLNLENKSENRQLNLIDMLQ